jgi:hypothetical protein
MIEPEGQRIQAHGEAEEFNSKIYEVFGIDKGTGRSVFTTRILSSRRGKK